MKGFIYSNQSWAVFILVVVVLVVLYFITKALPTKVEKKKNKAEKKSEDVNKKEDQESEKDKVDKSKQESTDNQEKTQDSDNKDKKEDKKPKIIQIYKREKREDSLNGEKKKSIDPIYDRNVEFINTSKNVAKFKSFADESKEESLEEEKTDEYGFVNDIQEDCNLCENKVKHFDHSRRLSKAIKEDRFDEMFDSHISEKYLNINSDRHLNLNEKFQKNLFERTEKMLSNSDGKVKNDQHEKSNFSLFSNNEVAEDSVAEEEVQIDMKTALIADTYLGKRKRKLK